MCNYNQWVLVVELFSILYASACFNFGELDKEVDLI